jgi:hypothetical protein
VGDPVLVDRQPADNRRTLRSVSPSEPNPEPDSAHLADELAAALRAIRGYVPHHIWWDAGPAHALLAYQALRAP